MLFMMTFLQFDDRQHNIILLFRNLFTISIILLVLLLDLIVRFEAQSNLLLFQFDYTLILAWLCIAHIGFKLLRRR
jgi:hypothetical protein